MEKKEWKNNTSTLLPDNEWTNERTKQIDKRNKNTLIRKMRYINSLTGMEWMKKKIDANKTNGKCTYFQKCISQTVFLFSHFNYVIEAKRKQFASLKSIFYQIKHHSHIVHNHLTLTPVLGSVNRFVCATFGREWERAKCMRFHATILLLLDNCASIEMAIYVDLFIEIHSRFFSLPLCDGRVYHTTCTIIQLMASISTERLYLELTRHKYTTFAK